MTCRHLAWKTSDGAKGSTVRLNRPVCGLKEHSPTLRDEMNLTQREAGAMHEATREDECPYDRADEQLTCPWYAG